MATIDLIVLGILKKAPMGAYDIQKLVEYRNISKWVKISTPSIYKKAIQLEEKGFIKGDLVKEGKMPEKVVYSLTEAGEQEFERLMLEISAKPISMFLDFNAVIVNLDNLPDVYKRQVLHAGCQHLQGCLIPIHCMVHQFHYFIIFSIHFAPPYN